MPGQAERTGWRGTLIAEKKPERKEETEKEKRTKRKGAAITTANERGKGERPS